MADFFVSIKAAIAKVWNVIGLGSFIPNPNATVTVSKAVIQDMGQAPFNLTPNEIRDTMFWWREGMDALNRARRDALFTTGEQVDAEVVANNGDFGDAARVIEFAEASQDAAGYEDRVRRCIAVGLVNTNQDFGVLRGRVMISKLFGRGSGVAWQYIQANAGNVWQNWLLPLLRLELRVVLVFLAIWAVSFGALIVGWFWAESQGRYGVGYILALLATLTTLFTFTVPIQIIDGNLTLLGKVAGVIPRIMEMVGVKERPEPSKELRWGLHMIYLFRWRAVLGVLVASVVNHVLVGMFGPHPEIWWIVFGSLMLGIAIAVMLQQETRTDNPAAKAYYRWSRIGLTGLFPVLAVVVITRLGVHGDLSPDGTWIVRTGLEVARVPLRYNLFQGVTTAMAIATACGAVLALVFKKWGPAAGLVLAAIVASGVVSCSTMHTPPQPAPPPISAWEDPAESPLHNGDIAGPTPATTAQPPASPTIPRAVSSYDDRRARAEAIRERARK